MVKKTIFGLLYALLGISLIALRNTSVFLIAMSVICFLMVYEVDRTVHIRNVPVMALSLFTGASFPFFVQYGERLQRLGEGIGLDLRSPYLICLYMLLLFVFMMFKSETTRIQDVSVIAVASLGLPYAVTRFLYFRDIAEHFPERGYGEHMGLFLILFSMFSAWITDSCAYFSGSFFGKHKMCPGISPKKTYEGAAGGIVSCVAADTALYAVFDNLIFETPAHNYLAAVLLSLLLSVAATCGDLFESLVKRNFGVKDFGNLVPGHGGMMDRFDSEVFVLIAFYAVFNIFEVRL